jgi:hypothetical protein
VEPPQCAAFVAVPLVSIVRKNQMAAMIFGMIDGMRDVA